MVEPQTFGFKEAAQEGSVTKFVKETERGRVIVYEADEISVQVNEALKSPSVAVADSGFFWRGTISEGSLYENELTDSVTDAHDAAQDHIREALA